MAGASPEEEGGEEEKTPRTISEKIGKLKLALQAGDMGPAAFDIECEFGPVPRAASAHPAPTPLGPRDGRFGKLWAVAARDDAATDQRERLRRGTVRYPSAEEQSAWPT